MDWFLYDNGLRHERVKEYFQDSCLNILGILWEKIRVERCTSGYQSKPKFYKINFS